VRQQSPRDSQPVAESKVLNLVEFCYGVWAHFDPKEGPEMAKAVWNGVTLAESEKIQVVEDNVYFPETSVKREYLRPSSTTSTCPWKGQARYYSLLVDGQENQDAAWYYPDPKPAARKIKGHIAFWRGVEVEK
jgi:uncharacterized protein (DUF427 family)